MQESLKSYDTENPDQGQQHFSISPQGTMGIQESVVFFALELSLFLWPVALLKTMNLNCNTLKMCLICICIGVCFFSCTNPRMGNAEDNKRAQGIYNTANRIFSEGKIKQSLVYLDSAYARLPVITPYGQYLGYNFKSLFYFHENDLDASLRYEDRALDMMKNVELQHSYPQEYVHTLLEKRAYTLSTK